MLQPGDLVCYCNHEGAETVEIGIVKRVCDDGASVAYHLGGTCAKTPYWALQKVSNDYALRGMLERGEQLGRRYDSLCDGCEDWGYGKEVQR